MSERQIAPAGWYWAEGDPTGTKRYWDGATWQGAPRTFPPEHHQVPPQQRPLIDRRDEVRQQQLRNANVRLGEGIPFHHLYMRTRRAKGNWF